MHRRSYERWAMKYAFPWKRAVTRPSYSRIPPRPLKRGAHFIEIARRTSAPLPTSHRTQACRNAAEITSAWFVAASNKRKKKKKRRQDFPRFSRPPLLLVAATTFFHLRRHNATLCRCSYFISSNSTDRRNLNERYSLVISYEFWNLKEFTLVKFF